MARFKQFFIPGHVPPCQERRPPRTHSAPSLRRRRPPDAFSACGEAWRGTLRRGRGTPRPGTRDGLDVGGGGARGLGHPPAGTPPGWDSLLETNGRLTQLNTSKLKKKKSKDNLWVATPPAWTRDTSAWDEGRTGDNTRATFSGKPGVENTLFSYAASKVLKTNCFRHLLPLHL